MARRERISESIILSCGCGFSTSLFVLVAYLVTVADGVGMELIGLCIFVGAAIGMQVLLIWPLVCRVFARQPDSIKAMILFAVVACTSGIVIAVWSILGSRESVFSPNSVILFAFSSLAYLVPLLIPLAVGILVSFLVIRHRRLKNARFKRVRSPRS